MNVEIKKDYYKIKIFFNGVIHLCLDKKEFIGYQSWTDGFYFSIEYYTKTQTILTEQDTRDKWIEILKELDKKL